MTLQARRVFYILYFLIGHVAFCQNSPNKGHRFYIKTEAWNSLKIVFEPKSYDLDLQVAFRLSHSSHIVATYGKTTYYLIGTAESTYTPGKFQTMERIGTSNHRSSLMYRWFPNSKNNDFTDFIFVEGGIFFHDYSGITNLTTYENVETNITGSSRRDLRFLRVGPQLNIGLARRYGKKKNEGQFSFSPEFYIGVYYNHVHIIEDDVTILIGPPEPMEGYHESKIRFALRAKIGFGFL